MFGTFEDEKLKQDLYDKMLSALIISRGSPKFSRDEMRDLAITARQLTAEAWKIKTDL